MSDGARPEGNVALVLPPDVGDNLMKSLRSIREEYGIDYLWIHGHKGAIGVVVSAAEFRRLRAAAGEPLRSPLEEEPDPNQLQIDSPTPEEA